MRDETFQNFYRFQLVGVRFSKLIVDEGAGALTGGLELTAEITRSKAELSEHTYGDRPVIEIRVGVKASAESQEGGSALPERVFNVECLAGFVARDAKDDGRLEIFDESIDLYLRGVYWMLRERLDSVFAVTSMRGLHLPWDVLPESLVSIERDQSSEKKTRAKTAKKVSKKKVN